MLPTNVNFDPFPTAALRLLLEQAKRDRAERDGRSFLLTWLPRLMVEGTTETNRRNLVLAANELSPDAYAWVRENRPAWRPRL